MNVIRATILVGGARTVSRALGLLRIVVLARLLGPVDLGIAATLWLTVGLLELISNIAADRIIVQAEDGDAPAFQRVAHLVLASRGGFAAVALLAAAGPVSRLFGIPEARTAFQVLALWPLLRGVAHLDVKRLHRRLDFRADVGIDLAAQAAALALAWPLAAWCGDYWAVVWISLAQAATGTIASHLVARRPYRWGVDRVLLRRMVRFGWPLALNGLLMFGIFQGDHFVIASAPELFGTPYSMADLGAYAVAFTLAAAPTVVLAQVNAALMLPTLSAVQNAPAAFARRYRLGAQALCVAAALASSLLLLAGPALVVAIYGPRYATGAPVIGWLAVMQAIRLVRAAPSMAAMALGDTMNVLRANLGRSMALPAMLAIAAAALDLPWIAAAGAGGEAIGLLIAAAGLRTRHGLPLAATFRPAALPLVVVAAAALLGDTAGAGLATALAAWVVLVPLLLLAAALTCLDLRRHLAAALHRRRAGASFPFAPGSRR